MDCEKTQKVIKLSKTSKLETKINNKQDFKMDTEEVTEQKTALIDLRTFLKTHGLKLGWIAREIGITDSLLRYHLDSGELPKEMERRIRAKLKEHGKLVKKLAGVRRRVFK